MPLNPEASETSPLAFAWEWDRAEYIRLHRALMREAWRNPGARLFRTLALLGGVVLLGILLYPLLRGEAGMLRAYIPWILLVIFWVVLFRWMLPHLNARAYRKLHRGTLRLRLDEEGVESGCEVCSNRLRWNAFSRAVETPEFIFLFYSPQCAMYLPKRALGPGDGQRLRDTVQSRLPGLSPA
jgi:hypothetical protein